MNNIITILLMLSIAFSSCKKTINNEMIVIKNCTGVYLKALTNENEYKVCNEKILYDFEGNTKINARYYFIENNKKCDRDIVCALPYRNDGSIEILKIK